MTVNLGRDQPEQDEFVNNEVAEANRKDELERFEMVFGAVSRILAHGVKGVKVEYSSHDVPAWTYDGHIFLNARILPDLSAGQDVDLATWLGMDYHEVGHNRYTPRDDSLLSRMVDKSTALYPGLKATERLAEDQRMERLMVSEFGPLSTYMTAAVAGMLAVTDVKKMGDIWPYVAGRTWLPPDLRSFLREEYNKGKAVPGQRGPTPKRDGRKIAKLIGQYQRLVDPGEADADEAYRIIVKLYEQLIDDNYDPDEIPDGCGHGAGKESTTEPQPGDGGEGDGEGEPVPVAGSEEDEENLEEGEKQRKEAKKRKPWKKSKDKGKGPSTGGERNSLDPPEGGDPTDGQGYDPLNTEPGEAMTDQSAGGTGMGKAGAERRDPLSLRDVSRYLSNSAREQIAGDVGTADDLSNLAEALDLRSKEKLNLPTISANYRKPDEELSLLARDLSLQFKQFTDRALPYWDRRVDQGKLNVGRFLKPDNYDYDSMFDRFEVGMQDDLSLDVSILIDRSGSMSGWGYSSTRSPMQQACEAGWAIQYGVETAGGTTSMIFYDDNSNVLVQPGDKVNKELVAYVGSGGNTDPTRGLVEVYQRLRLVDAYHKLVIAVTDGGWGGGRDTFAAIGKLPGVTTASVVLTSAGNLQTGSQRQQMEAVAQNLGGHVYRAMASPMGLVDLVAELVTNRMAQVMRGYAG